ncbi:hypothetical protein O181_095876 [Austropuccinia psidii MF-1]|uniref:DDE Tnp4 domain-containing protein n=1 Tax=Austropuccinia psidii MF-1 TaxID=1389203 RepID=A0A9Q3PDQ9_9BASI|nr:hypothetical protein [Austropuccinia psidii MF-1]
MSRFPVAEEIKKWDAIKETFQQRQGLTNIIGAIDGMHIPIIPPPNDQWNAYVNHKGWHCIVDGHGNFCNVSNFNYITIKLIMYLTDSFRCMVDYRAQYMIVGCLESQKLGKISLMVLQDSHLSANSLAIQDILQGFQF